jgi:hypothetical protein
MRLLGRAVPAALAVLLSVTVTAAAGDADRERADFKPVHRLAGSTAGTLLGQWWALSLAIPAPQHPNNPANPALCQQLGRRGKVLAVDSAAPRPTCTMRANQKLFIPASGSECSDAEPVDGGFYGATEAEQRACAIGWAVDPAFVTAITLSLDGGPPVSIRDERFLVVSPQFDTVFPQDPIFDATPGPATFVAANYAATPRRDLRPGRHEITLEVTFPGGSFTQTLVIDVTRGGHGHH